MQLSSTVKKQLFDVVSTFAQKIRICPECKQMFVYRRKDQTNCSGKCARRLCTRRWWALHGNEWRRQRRVFFAKNGGQNASTEPLL